MIAALLFSIGIMLKADYTATQDGTGGYRSLTAQTLIRDFKYAKAVDLDTEIDLNLLKQDLIKERPIYLIVDCKNDCSDINPGSHAIIADGYKETGEFHFNFGWGKDVAYGWYFFPENMPYDYNMISYAMINIEPFNDSPYCPGKFFVDNTITMSGNGQSWETAFKSIREAHFEIPKISALFSDLNPRQAICWWKQTTESVLITFENIEGFYGGNNNVQVELFFNGIIKITYLDIQVDHALVGLSKGQGLSDCFQESQFFKSNPESTLSQMSQELLDLSGSSLFMFSNDQNILRLTSNQPWQTGTAFTKVPKTTQSFSTFFSFMITDAYYSGADGFVFVIKSHLDDIGANAAGLGYSGIKNSIGIEFDTYLHYEYNDPDDHHIGIVENGNSFHPLGYSYINPDFKNGNIWYAWIDYDGKTLEARINHCLARPEKPQLSKQINLSEILGKESGYFGFTASTGGYWENHDIIEWELKEYFEPIIKEVEIVTYYVDGSVETSGDGLSWETSFKTIYEAVNHAGCLVEIFIKQGTYVLNEPIITQAMQTNIYGGFKGNEKDINDRSDDNKTVIDGQNLVQCFVVDNQNNILLDRMTIINGINDNGGAVFINNSKATIKNVIFNNNHAIYNGGAIWNFNKSNLTLVNCLFFNNISEKNVGGAIYNDYLSQLDIVNCTFYENTAKTNGGAIYAYKSKLNIVNSIFWNDTAKHESEISIDELSQIKVTFSTIKGYFFGHGNTDYDPMFVDPEQGNFQLKNNSLCINAGSEKISIIEPIDLSARTRMNGKIDMGAYEFQNTFNILEPTITALQENKIQAQTIISVSNPKPNDLIVSLKSESINLPSFVTIPSGISSVSFNIDIPTPQIIEESIYYTMVASIENYVTSTYIIQIDENKEITFTAYYPNWANDAPIINTTEIILVEKMQIYDLDNSGDTNIEDVILALKIITGYYFDHSEKITLKTPVYLLKLLAMKEPPIIYEPLSYKSEQILSKLDSTYPTILQQVKNLIDDNNFRIDKNKAINNLNIYLTNEPPEDIQKGIQYILMPEYFQKHNQSKQIQITIDGKNTEWSSVPNKSIDVKGDGHNKEKNMDMVEANSLFKVDEENLYVMIAMDDIPLTFQYFSFLIDYIGSNEYELEILVFGWEDGNLYCRYNDLLHGLYNRPFQMEVSIDEIFEAKIPLFQFTGDQKLKSRIKVLPRTFDINLITKDEGPKMVLPVSFQNHALILLLHLLENEKFIQGDIMTVAMSLSDNFIHAISDEHTRKMIKKDIIQHFEFYENVIKWQEDFQLNYQLKNASLIPKLLWADRCGKYYIYVSDITEFSQLENLTLDLYCEFVDRIDTMYSLHEIIKDNHLFDFSINNSVARIETYVSFHLIYRSTMENLIAYREKWDYYDQILLDAIEDKKNGGYYTYYFGKTRKWDGFMWLNYQTNLLKKTGYVKGDCGTNTCINMGLYKAAGIPPLSIQRASVKHFGYTHNFSAYYDVGRNRWYAYQEMPRGDVDINIYFHKFFPHHWIIDTEISYSDELTYSSLYQGETVPVIRAENLLSQGIDPEHFESIVMSDITHNPGFIFNDNTAPLIIPDQDKDGLCDSHENDLLTNYQNWDSDNDLVSDTWEILNGYDPNSKYSPQQSIMAADGFVDDIINQKDYFEIFDKSGDSQVYTNVFDISGCYAALSNESLHVGIQFHNDISCNRSRYSELWLYTGIESPIWYWIYCGVYFSGGTYDSSFCSLSKLIENNWISLETENDINFTIARDAEFQIPLKYFNNPDSISIQYSIASGPKDNEIRASDAMDDYLQIITDFGQ